MKAANVMLNGRDHVKILDFGIAEDLSSGQSSKREKVIRGTVGYMSPEQTRGDRVDQRTDIWSLGVVIYEMLTGVLPFRADYEQSVIYAIVNNDPDPISAYRTGVPSDFERIVIKCLAKDRGQRYQNAGDLLADLRRFKAEIDSKEILARTGIRTVPVAGRFRGLVVPAAVLAIILSVLLVAYLRNGSREAAGAQIPIAVADIVNETGEPELDGLSGMLVTSLEQSRLLSVLTRSRMFDILEQLGREHTDLIDEPLGREICREANINVLVVASIRKFDDLYTIDLKAYDTNTENYLVTATEQGRGKSSIPAMIDKIAGKTRRGFKENTTTLAASSENIADIMTENLDAYQQYFLGEQHLNHLEFDEARDAFRKSVALDSSFALAHYRLAYTQWWNRETEGAQRAQLAKALALVDHLPERFRYLLRAQVAVLDGGYEAGISVLEEMKKLYPDDKEMIFNLGDFSFHAKKYEDAAAYLEQVLSADARDERALNHLAMTYIAMRDKPKAIAIAERYVDVTGSEEAYVALINAHFIDGDTKGAVRVATDARRALPSSPLVQNQYAVAEMLSDRLEPARATLDSLVAEDRPERVLLLGYGNLAAVNLHTGRYREALAHIERRQTLAFYEPDRADSIAAIFQNELAGLIYDLGWNDTANGMRKFEKAAAIKEALAQSALDSTSLDDYYANLAIHSVMSDRPDFTGGVVKDNPGGDHRLTDRIRFLTYWKEREHDRACALGDSLLSEVSDYQKTAIWYFLSLSQLADGRYDAAIASLESLQEDIHYGAPRPVFYVPSYFLLGRAYEEKGDVVRAISNYEKFLGFWKNADRDLVILEQANERLAGLRASAAQ